MTTREAAFEHQFSRKHSALWIANLLRNSCWRKKSDLATDTTLSIVKYHI
jgi:hypothetical protein